jgi:hypothetical protein
MCQKLFKCLFCEKLFQAERRNAKHQKYCSDSDCRKASKAASQRAWLAKSENQDYFRSPENVARVQVWREAHPGYWRRPGGNRGFEPDALQDVLITQPVEKTQNSVNLNQIALQDLLSSQNAVLIGFIAHFTGSALQDDIVRSTRRLVKLGQDILTGRVSNDYQTGNLHQSGP